MPAATSAPLTSAHAVPRRLSALAALALAQIGVAIYQTHHFYEVRNGSAGFQSLCNLGQAMNCDAVAASRYAELLPGLPLSSFVAGWFAAILIVAITARNAFWRRDGVRALALLTGFAALMSIVYLTVMVSILKTLCLFCLVTDGLILLAFALALSLKPEGLRAHKPEKAKWRTFGTITAISLAVSLAGLRVLDSSEMTSAQADDMIKSVLATPVLPMYATPELPSLGPADAPITIVEFSDFQCPYCRLGAFSLNTVLQRYPTQVRVVFRNFPLDQACNRKVDRMMHAHACEAARAAVCAHKQGKFAAVYEEFFQNQESISSGPDGASLKLAQDAGADGALLNACLVAPETGAAISRDIEDGITLGVSSTPTFFINGHRANPMPPAAWSKLIDQLLAGAGKN